MQNYGISQLGLRKFEVEMNGVIKIVDEASPGRRTDMQNYAMSQLGLRKSEAEMNNVR